MGVFLDPGRRIARIPDDDLHAGQDHVHRVFKALGVEVALLADELHEIQRCEVTGAVVQVHVLGTRVRGVDPRRVLRGVPAVDGVVELHPRVAAAVGRFRDLSEQLPGADGVHRLTGGDRAGGPVFVVFDRPHERIAHPNAVVGVLVLDGRIGLAVQGSVIARADERVRLLLLAGLAVDEVEDVRVIHIENHHLGGPAGLAATPDDAGKGVISLHEGNRPGGPSSARQLFA